MEKVFSQEMIRLLAIAGVAGIGLTAVLGRWIAKLRGSFKPYQKQTVIYLLASIGLFLVVGLTGFWHFFGSYTKAYIVYQILFAGLGALHLYAMYRFLPWSGDGKSTWLELIFTFIVMGFGFVAYSIVYKWMNPQGMHFTMASSILFFFISFLVYQTYVQAVAIPPKVYKKWYYPMHTEVADPDEAKLKNMLVISFKFQKNNGDPHYTNFRAKAPTDMEFGELFYYFINDYNERHPQSKIEFVNTQGKPHGWFFYKKPRWYTVFTEYIDPEKTFFVNHIQEDDTVVCARVSS